MESLSVRYRPKTFSEVVSQVSVIKILKRQLETDEIKNAYLFCGPSGDGKTTIARIFANEVNNGQGTPIEIDAASNNGVDNVRNIIDEAKSRALDSKYKVFIIDEVHMITTAGWNAFLKCLEEPPQYTIFLFCTTDPQKIPSTILNRVMRFQLTRISTNLIRDRLKYVCQQEGYTNYEEACDFVARLSNGGMRDALAYIEKCADYSRDLCITNVIQALGNFSYATFLKLTNSLFDRDQKEVLNIIEDCYNSGNDLKLFIEQYLEFILDLNKYCLFNDISLTKIPASLEVVKTSNGKLSPLCIKYATGFEGNVDYYNKLVKILLDLKTSLKYDTMPKTTICVKLIDICRSL